MKLLYKDEVYAIIGAAIEVHKQLGHGFLEAVYQEALAIEMNARTIPFRSQQPIRVQYKEISLKAAYIADFVAFDKIIMELKAIDKLGVREDSQLLNYLKASRFQVGLLINFGASGKLEWKRMVNTTGRRSE